METETSKITRPFSAGRAGPLRSPMLGRDSVDSTPTKRVGALKRKGPKRTDSGEIVLVGRSAMEDENHSSGSIASVKELERKVDDLSAKIAELTALIMAQNGGTGSEE